MSKQLPKTYKSCSDIPIYNFMMFLSTQDYKYLISNIKKASKESVEKFLSSKGDYLKKVFEKIEEEYKELTFSKRDSDRHRDIVSMMILESKYNAIIKILKVYSETKEVTVLDLLNKLGGKFDVTKPINEQILNAKKLSKGLKNQLNIKTANFKIKYKVDDNDIEDEKEDTSGNVEKSLDAQALSMESNLETGYEINIRKTSVLRWVNLREANDRKIEQFNK